jgi:hypothetical protein
MSTSSAFGLLFLVVLQEAFLGTVAVLAVYLAVCAAVRTVVRGLETVNVWPKSDQERRPNPHHEAKM